MALAQFSLQMNKQAEIGKVSGDVKSEKAILLRAKVSFSVQDTKAEWMQLTPFLFSCFLVVFRSFSCFLSFQVFFLVVLGSFDCAVKNELLVIPRLNMVGFIWVYSSEAY
jgi:hypothetical protein